jgi:alpha-L-fucosidase
MKPFLNQDFTDDHPTPDPLDSASPGVGDGEFFAYAPSPVYTPPTDPRVLRNLSRWQGYKFGVLFDWQACTQWGIDSWPLCPEQWDWNVRKDFIHDAPEGAEPDSLKYKRSYEALAQTFYPAACDPEGWAELLQIAGVRYVLIMTKHHDGFCLWNTAQTDYKTTSVRCPFHQLAGADVVKSLGDALRQRGIRVGLYFSKPDWNSPWYWSPEFPLFPPGSEQIGVGRNPNYDPRKHPDLWKKFKDFTWAQIEELMRNYGEIDILWLDGGQVNPSNNGQDLDMPGLAAMARSYQPGLLVVDRCVGGAHENYITPEGESAMPDAYQAYPWEACMPIGKHWNFFPHDDLKSPGELVRYLCRATARGGNYLLGIGPDARGEFDPGVVARLRHLGVWLKQNGEAIYGTAPLAPYEHGACLFTARKDGTRYAIVLAADDSSPMPEQVTVPGHLLARAGGISLLPFDEPLESEPGPQGQRIVPIPARIREIMPVGMAWVIRFTP